MSVAPRLSVFMPVHNRDRYVAFAVESVLAQTFRDFELLVIDDASTDKTPEVLASFRDPRIRIVRHDTNRGIPATRNHGLELARGELLAMLDSDDLAHPTRFEKQIRFLDQHRDHAVVGSWARKINELGRAKKILRRPLTWQRIRARLLFVGTIRTPSTMGRTEILRRYDFRSEFPVCSDSDFWVRLALEHRCANLPEPLIDYRIHKESATKSQQDLVRDRKMAIAAAQLERLGVPFDDDDLSNHFQLRKPKHHALHPAFGVWTREWLQKLLEANRSRGLYPEPHFGYAVAERWHELWRQDGETGGYAGLQLLDPALRPLMLRYLAQRAVLTARWGRGLA